MFSIAVKVEWDAAHRILKHGSKCRHLHGHRYVAEVHIRGENLNDLNMVEDFQNVRSMILDHINHNWDHNIFLNKDDPLVTTYPDAIGDRPPVICNGEPTAEFIAANLRDYVQDWLGGIHYPHLRCSIVRVWETPNCSACAFG